jgi:hypothetical protein
MTGNAARAIAENSLKATATAYGRALIEQINSEAVRGRSAKDAARRL